MRPRSDPSRNALSKVSKVRDVDVMVMYEDLRRQDLLAAQLEAAGWPLLSEFAQYGQVPWTVAARTPSEVSRSLDFEYRVPFRRRFHTRSICVDNLARLELRKAVLIVGCCCVNDGER